MDLVWYFLRLFLSKLFNINIIFRNLDEQRILGWSGFNVEIFNKRVFQIIVGYCLMIFVFFIEYSIIYIVMK